jgi:hypothetical protein
MPQADHRRVWFLIGEIGHLTGIEIASIATPPKLGVRVASSCALWPHAEQHRGRMDAVGAAG